jgi:hypothetical protein
MIDQDIRQALNVDPSPEFLARVRARVAREPAPSAWRWPRSFAAAAALAAAAVVAVTLSEPWKSERAQSPEAPSSLRSANAPSVAPSRQPASAAMPPIGKRAIAKSQRRVFDEHAGASGSSPTVAEAEVLIDPAEQRALQRLIAGVRDGRIDLSAAQSATEPAPPQLAPLTDIVITPINIEPLAPSSGAEGVHP